jgi:uncharacterized membrane protein YedE/YeeE
MKAAAALVAGVLFAFGLAIGGMTDPLKVISFLNVAGPWDPSLAFVMGGAIAVYSPVFWLTRKMRSPVLDVAFHLPTRRDIDSRLIFGAILFGAGWGLGGFCPGPALVSTMSFKTTALVFTGSMLVGMAGFSLFSARRQGS